MRRTPWQRVVLIALVATVVGYLLLAAAESRGAVLLPPPLLSGLVVLVIAAVTFSLGWAVRQYTRGDRPSLDPLLAARTVVLATASAYTGALLTGWYAAHVLVVLGDLAIPARRAVAVAAGLAALGAVLLAAVGLLVERWCEVRPPDDEPPATGLSSGTAA